jgi:superfamily II DNA/RNA helicase
VPTEKTIQLVRQIRVENAGAALTPAQAKLYSQRARRAMGQEGLASFTASDVRSHLDEAILLIQSGLIERQADPEGRWRDAVKRGAEILEWLSEQDLRPSGVPVYLLAASAFQVARLPAMAQGHLRRTPLDDGHSRMLDAFLRADFPGTLEAVRSFWDKEIGDDAKQLPTDDLSILTARHVVMALGTLCNYFRTGNPALVERALAKLESLSSTLVYSRDGFSYLLGALTAATSRVYAGSSLWKYVRQVAQNSDPTTAAALEQFARSSYANRRSLVWPAQATGIERLSTGQSFVLCTPTGSGKTSVATLGIVQSLFTKRTGGFDGIDDGNLILYLVPSRALAAEVEARLAQDLRGVSATPVMVTGLYGGIDWGPTDAWISRDQPTAVICTFEKADALIRYLGILFLHRVRMVVIDEAHMVEQHPERLDGLANGTSRSLRLEQLGARLLNARAVYGFRVIALSAVAANAAPALARWITAQPEAMPVSSESRSTRQMVGLIQVNPDRTFSIRYQLMNGHSLRFQEAGTAETPFIPRPFPSMPRSLPDLEGPEKSMRVPTLWSALNLAAERSDGSRPSVLISLTQSIEPFAATCADQMDAWDNADLPQFSAIDAHDDRWVRCLAAAEDYFTKESTEYRLLVRGIAVHHGKLPSLLARRLKGLIDSGHVRVIIATSTLSEGVNIPVNYVLLPSLYRATSPLSLQEFTNLIGRAGRPSVATEGHALVVLPPLKRTGQRIAGRQWQAYANLVQGLQSAQTVEAPAAKDDASSALAHVLTKIEDAWKQIVPGGTTEQFQAWLEATAVTDNEDETEAKQYLDTLDGFLLAATEEIEALQGGSLSLPHFEAALIDVWQRTYAYAAAKEETRLRRIWLGRGAAIRTRYPDASVRRQIYKSSLTPRSAIALAKHADAIRAELVAGFGYAEWGIEQRVQFIRTILAKLSEIPAFRISTNLGKKKGYTDWPKILRWWVAKETLETQPRAQEITNWYEFTAQNFIYRGAWGLGSVLGVFMDIGSPPIRALELDDWPKSGLPWAAFWLKEIISWGTHDPVAAFLLARGNAINRQQAAIAAKPYYEQVAELPPNDRIDPRRIRDWMAEQSPSAKSSAPLPDLNLAVQLEADLASYREERLSVFPLQREGRLIWIDAAGYLVARSDVPTLWPSNLGEYEFELRPILKRVVGQIYRRFA